MKIATVVGARPQFIKAAPVSRALRKAGHNEFLVHTGQHYDDNMSSVFFEELEIPEPDVNLGIGSGSHGQQTGNMLMRIEQVLMAQNPDWVLVYGDTNSTLAGALAAVKLHIPVAHVEAGLRSFNREMPEEHNRVLTDHCSDVLFCPTETAVQNLKREGIAVCSNRKVRPQTSNLKPTAYLVGDVMYDSVLYNTKLAEKRSHVLKTLNLKPQNYALATVHRAENTDDHERLKSIFYALERMAQDGLPVIIPLHPRTRNILQSTNPFRLQPQTSNLKLMEAVPYLDMLLLEKQARIILTDSGGVQKEAYWFGVPCVTLRKETEWVETVESGWNLLVGCDPGSISEAVEQAQAGSRLQDAYGKGRAAERIVHLLSSVSA